MPITQLNLYDDPEQDDSQVKVFHVQESIEVYDGVLALAVDHLLNHIKVLVSQAYIPGTDDLNHALKRHPLLKRMQSDPVRNVENLGGRTPDRVLLKECLHLLESVVEIAHLAAYPETQEQAQKELTHLQREVPFLDFRYDNDPFPSDKDRDE